MAQKSVRSLELDQDTDLWLAQIDEDPDDLVNDLLRRYRDAEDS